MSGDQVLIPISPFKERDIDMGIGQCDNGMVAMEEHTIWVPSCSRSDLLVSAGRLSWRQGVEEEETPGGSSWEVMVRPTGVGGHRSD